jgi:hypothetical protein
MFNQMKPALLALAVLLVNWPMLQAQSQKEKVQQRVHLERIGRSKALNSTIVSLDTLYKGGLPVCIFKPLSRSLLGADNFSVRRLSDNEESILIARGSTNNLGKTVYYWVWVVTEAGKQRRFETAYTGFLDPPDDPIGDFMLMTDTGVHEANLEKFIQAKAGNFSDPPAPEYSPMRGMVERKRTAPVTTIGTDVLQDLKKVGTVHRQKITVEYKVLDEITVRFTDGTLVARAVNEKLNGHEWTVYCVKDKRTFQMTTAVGSDEKDIVRQLIDQFYL